MIRLVVNQTEIPLEPGETIQLRKSASKIGQLARRQGNYTNDFQVQMTNEVIEAFGFPNFPNTVSAQVNYRRRLPAALSQGMIEISRGYIQILSVDHISKTISVSFFGGNSGWVSALSGMKIADLDLEDLEHTWTAANIVSSWANESGYIYPLIDYGKFVPELLFFKNFVVEDFYPAIFQKEIVERGMSQAGFKLAGTFLNEFAYKRAILPFASKDFLSSIEFANQFVGMFSGSGTYTQTYIFSPVTVIDIEKLIMTTANQDAFNSFSTADSTFTASKTETYKMRLTTDIANFQTQQILGTSAGSNTIVIRVTDQTGTEILPAQVVLTSIGPGTFSTSGIFIWEFDWAATIGEKIKAEVVYTHTPTSGATLLQYIAAFNSYSLECTTIDRTMVEGDTVQMQTVVPDLLVVDVIRDMAQRHGLIIYTDDYTQTVYLDRFERMPFMPPVDWSDKVSLLDVHEIDFSSVIEGYFRFNKWNYSESKEEDLVLYAYDQENERPMGEGLFEIDSDWLSEEGTIYRSIYRATPMESIWTGGSNLYLPVIRVFNDLGVNEFDPAPRILYVLPDVDVSEVILGVVKDISFESVRYEQFAYAFFYLISNGKAASNIEDSLSYGNIVGINSNQRNLIDTNYNQIQKILDIGQAFSVSMILREHEFLNLDFSQPVYLDVGLAKGLFFVNEVSGYEGSNVPCEVQLIRVA